MAARAGAVIADPEFVQFHPTAIAVGRDPAPLATEALRGEGAHLVNRAGERFMLKVHAAAELAPRDVVARAILAELSGGRGAFLDCREAIGDRFPERFPTVFRSCMEAGIDPRTALIPVAPAEHYHMGGVATDGNGRASIAGLYACGEVASTGAHGANRLASNSLLEAVVFAARVATDLKATLPSPRSNAVSLAPDGAAQSDADDVARLRRTMSEMVGVVRTGAGLTAALAEIARLTGRTRSPSFRNSLAAAQLIAAGARARTESRGGHFRADYPAADPAWQRRTFLTLGETAAHAARPAAVAAAR
jgi:L-aspartate oxidase